MDSKSPMPSTLAKSGLPLLINKRKKYKILLIILFSIYLYYYYFLFKLFNFFIFKNSIVILNYYIKH